MRLYSIKSSGSEKFWCWECSTRLAQTARRSGERMETSAAAEPVAAVTFSAGGFHLQIPSATPQEEMKMSPHSAAYSSAGEERRGAARRSRRPLSGPCLCGEMSRGAFSIRLMKANTGAAAAAAAAGESHKPNKHPCVPLQLQDVDSEPFGTLIPSLLDGESEAEKKEKRRRRSADQSLDSQHQGVPWRMKTLLKTLRKTVWNTSIRPSKRPLEDSPEIPRRPSEDLVDNSQMNL